MIQVRVSGSYYPAKGDYDGMHSFQSRKKDGFGGKMDTAKLFINGRSQAVRLPKAYRFEGKEVYIKKVSQGILIIPKDKSVWGVWEKNL